MARPRSPRRLFANALHSIAGKLVVLLVIFVAVPVIVFQQFRAADIAQRSLLSSTLSEQGRLVTRGLEPILRDFSGANVRRLSDAMGRFGAPDLRIKVLLRPNNKDGSKEFFYVAAYPQGASAYLEQERTELLGAGVLTKLSESCDAGISQAVRYRNPAGNEELLTSINALETDKGCWAIILSRPTNVFLGSSLGRPYWKSPEVRVAAAIYGLMALLVLGLFVSMWQSLRRFARLARHKATVAHDGGGGFRDLNTVPELQGIAGEFDRMVETLRGTAHAIRIAAHENAHALKTPIAIISQSLEPIRRALPDDAEQARKAGDRIEKAVERLDSLVSTARRMDEAIAESIEPRLQPTDLSALLDELLDNLRSSLRERSIHLHSAVQPHVMVTLDHELFETAIENLLENAADFTPENGTVRVHLRRDGQQAELRIEDQGPGVPPDDLERIFERYYSSRPDGAPAGHPVHFGIGLWIVRRNIDSLGGRIEAQNRDDGGLCMTVRLPLQR